MPFSCEIPLHRGCLGSYMLNCSILQHFLSQERGKVEEGSTSSKGANAVLNYKEKSEGLSLGSLTCVINAFIVGIVCESFSSEQVNVKIQNALATQRAQFNFQTLCNLSFHPHLKKPHKTTVGNSLPNTSVVVRLQCRGALATSGLLFSAGEKKAWRT